MIAAPREVEPAGVGAGQAAGRNLPSTRLNETRVRPRALRSPRVSDETLPWVLLTLAAMLGLATGFGAMGRLIENWNGFVSLMARCLD